MDTETPLNIRQLTPADIVKLREQWLAFGEGDDEFPVEAYERAILWAKDVSSGEAKTDAKVHGVIDDTGNIHAIFDLVEVRPHLPKGFFKILSIVVGPHVDLNRHQNDDAQAVRGLAKVVTEAVWHGVQLLRDHQNAVKLKIFASDRVTLNTLQRVWTRLDDDIMESLNLSSGRYGNWVELSKAC